MRDDVESRTLFCLPTRFLFFKMGHERACSWLIEMTQDGDGEFRREEDTCGNRR